MSQNFEYFGKYILLEKLAMGGMAEVFLSKAAGAGGIGKFFAIKRILPQYSDNKDFNRMFKDEAKVVMNLKHANIVSIFEFGVEKGQFFLVMDFVDGKNLRQILNKMKKQKVKFTIEQVVYIVKEVAAGLDHAHRCQDTETGKPLNITHRDVSPQNIMISYDGEMKVVDFGIAKAESQIENTRAGTLKGKFGYMSPEQAEGHPVDLRTDVFSLGIILWELLANERLFISNNEINTLKKIRECKVPSLKEYVPNIHPDLEQIVYKALTKDRNVRYQTAAALQRDLSRFLNRQFPDYAPQDFAKSIKTLFADEILESRNKIVQYAKQSAQLQPPKVNDGHTYTHAAPKDEGNKILDMLKTNSLPEESHEKLDLSRFNTSKDGDDEDKTQVTGTESSALDSSALQKELSRSIQLTHAAGKMAQESHPDLPKRPNNPAATKTQPSLNKPLQKKSTSIQYNSEGSTPRPSFKRSGPSQTQIAFMVIGFLMLFATGIPFLKRIAPNQMNSLYKSTGIGIFEVTTGPQIEATENSSEEKNAQMVSPSVTKEAPSQARFYIQSNPSGAEIYINGKNTGYVTPATIYVPNSQPFNVELRRTGYISYQKEQINLSQGDESNIETTLYPMDTAKLDIDVRPVGRSRVYINGKWLEGETLPIRGYVIPANTRIVIKAVNPFNNASSQQVIKLKKGERKAVMLRLKKGRTPSSR
ncbi:MAG: serine/threonine protein kinase [Bdellovibrionales bacterium]|nr:serine/threonine protein kinase [Bdellovibrionales bacterium]